MRSHQGRAIVYHIPALPETMRQNLAKAEVQRELDDPASAAMTRVLSWRRAGSPRGSQLAHAHSSRGRLPTTAVLVESRAVEARQSGTSATPGFIGTRSCAPAAGASMPPVERRGPDAPPRCLHPASRASHTSRRVPRAVTRKPWSASATSVVVQRFRRRRHLLGVHGGGREARALVHSTAASVYCY